MTIANKLMSYSQAENVAKLVNFSNAVELKQEETYLTEVAYLKSVASQQQFLKSLAAQQQAAQAAAATQAATAQAAARAQAVAAPAPAPAPAPTLPAATGGVSDGTSTSTADWACIRQHESNDNYAEGNGGTYQFDSVRGTR